MCKKLISIVIALMMVLALDTGFIFADEVDQVVPGDENLVEESEVSEDGFVEEEQVTPSDEELAQADSNNSVEEGDEDGTGDEPILGDEALFEANGYSLEYKIDANKNEAYITGYRGQPVDVTIPDEIEGRPVVAVGIYDEGQAFNSCEPLKTVVMGKNVKSIGSNAFFSCTNLEKVVLPEGFKKIGDQAFSSCTKLNTINFPDSLTYIGDKSFRVTALESVRIPPHASVQQEAFLQCESLKSIEVCNGVGYIANGAFSSSGVESIVIPPSWTYIHEGTFDFCRNLKEVVFHDNITNIDARAFESTAIEDLYIPESVRRIEKKAFFSCYKIKRIDFHPQNVYVGSDAFGVDGDPHKASVVYTPDPEMFKVGPKFADEGAIPKGEKYVKITKITADMFKPIEEITYDGKEHTITVEPVSKDKLPDGVYTQEETVVTNAGKYKIKINATEPRFSQYIGSCELGFEIGRRAIDTDDITVDVLRDEMYTGKAITPEVKITSNDGAELVPGDDYVVVYSDNVEVGTATVKIVGSDNCSGRITTNFNIVPRQLDADLVKVRGISNKTYTGSEITQDIEVVCGKTILEEGEDYEVKYEGNNEVGLAKVIIEGKGNYAGSVESSFKISPKAAAISSLTSGKRKLTVKMTTKPSAKGVTTYQIAYKMKGAKSWKYTTTTSQSKTIKSLKKGKKYYVEVRSYKKVGDTLYVSAWSKAKLSGKIK
ncbi:MAG: fibronectin type III domain-containing protein [Eubacterium sp.]|nr:fibronectin type III domain-containing protein [Candidatus Colimonas fimequi]